MEGFALKRLMFVAITVVMAGGAYAASEGEEPQHIEYPNYAPAPRFQT